MIMIINGCCCCIYGHNAKCEKSKKSNTYRKKKESYREGMKKSTNEYVHGEEKEEIKKNKNSHIHDENERVAKHMI